MTRILDRTPWERLEETQCDLRLAEMRSYTAQLEVRRAESAKRMGVGVNVTKRRLATVLARADLEHARSAERVAYVAWLTDGGVDEIIEDLLSAAEAEQLHGMAPPAQRARS